MALYRVPSFLTWPIHLLLYYQLILKTITKQIVRCVAYYQYCVIKFVILLFFSIPVLSYCISNLNCSYVPTTFPFDNNWIQLFSLNLNLTIILFFIYCIPTLTLWGVYLFDNKYQFYAAALCIALRRRGEARSFAYTTLSLSFSSNYRSCRTFVWRRYRYGKMCSIYDSPELAITVAEWRVSRSHYIIRA